MSRVAKKPVIIPSGVEVTFSGTALVDTAIGSLMKHSIRALTQTYITLSINQIASIVKTTPTEVMSLLCEMIDEGSIQAQISRADGMVSFEEDPRVAIENVEEQILKVYALGKQVEQLDELVSLSLPAVAEKLRNLPNYPQLMQEYEMRRKAARGVSGAVQEFFRGN